MIEQAEGVEGVADDLCDGPGCDEEQHAVFTLHLGGERTGEAEEPRAPQRSQHAAVQQVITSRLLNAQPCCCFQTHRNANGMLNTDARG